MTNDRSSGVDPRRIRTGLAMIVVVFAVALALFIAIDKAVVRAIMAAIIVLTVMRVSRLRRSLRGS